MKKLVLVGGGELARVIIEAATASGWDVVGFLDPEPCEETSRRLGVPRLGGDEAIESIVGDVHFILGVGSIKVSDVRRRIVERLSILRWGTVIHPSAHVSSTADVRPGAVILAGAAVMTGARIGAHAIINLGVMVDHDVRVGDFVHVASGAVLGGGVKIGDDAYVGLGAVIRDHLTIGHRTLVGMGAVVIREFPAGSVLVGVPAKPMEARSSIPA